MSTPTEVIQSAREHGARLIDIKNDRHLRYLATLQPRPRIERGNLRGRAVVESLVDSRRQEGGTIRRAANLALQPIKRIPCVNLDFNDQQSQQVKILTQPGQTRTNPKSGISVRNSKFTGHVAQPNSLEGRAPRGPKRGSVFAEIRGLAELGLPIWDGNTRHKFITHKRTQG